MEKKEEKKHKKSMLKKIVENVCKAKELLPSIR